MNRLRDFLKDVIALGSEDGSEGCPFELPMRLSIDFENPCVGGLKVSIPSDDGKSEWLGFKALPLTCAEKGILARPDDRDI